MLQRSLPDRVRAFSLGLADSVMVLAALLGALAAPSLTTILGPVALFVGLATILAVVAIGFPSGVSLDGGLVFVVTTCPFPKRRATPVGRLTPARRR